VIFADQYELVAPRDLEERVCTSAVEGSIVERERHRMPDQRANDRAVLCCERPRGRIRQESNRYECCHGTTRHQSSPKFDVDAWVWCRHRRVTSRPSIALA